MLLFLEESGKEIEISLPVPALGGGLGLGLNLLEETPFLRIGLNGPDQVVFIARSRPHEAGQDIRVRFPVRITRRRGMRCRLIHTRFDRRQVDEGVGHGHIVP